MTGSASPPSSPVPSPGPDHTRVTALLRRATWTILIALVGIAVALVAARQASAAWVERAIQNREALRLALNAEIAATNREGAARLALGSGDSISVDQAEQAAIRERAYLDTLDVLAAQDTAVRRYVQAVREAIEIWENGFGRAAVAARARVATTREYVRPPDVRERVLQGVALFRDVRLRFEELVAYENAAYREHATGRTRANFLGTFLLLGGIALLALIAWQMRRQLSAQLAELIRSHGIIGEQNRDLREHTAALELQTRRLSDQATELDQQRAHLEEQTVELEVTLEELNQAQQGQRALTEETQRLNRRLTEAQRVAGLGYWEIDSTTGEVFWSDEMYRFCGAEPGTLPVPADRYLQCVHPDDRSRLALVVENATRNRAEFTEQYRLNENGKSRTMQAIARIVLDASGQSKLIGTVQDITDRVQLERQLRQGQKMEAVGRLAGGVAHDVNNMLTVVSGYAQMIAAAAADSPSIQASVREILAATERSSDITRQLLTFSRNRLIQPRVLELNQTLQDMQAMLSRLIGEDIDLVLRLERTSLPVLADPAQITQVLMNLAVNSRDAMPIGGKLVMETSLVHLDDVYAARHPGMHAGPHAMIAVTDSGIGMDAETQAQAFDPFFTTKPEGQGTGLGLATVFGIVQQMGGQVWLYSEPGHGTTFKIYFPMHAAESSDAVIPETTPPVTIRGARILVVEDDPMVRRITSALLRRAGYVVVEASNGIEALDLVRSNSVDLVLSDTVMPRMGGRELAEHLAAEHPLLPIVLTSGYTADTLHRHGAMPDHLGFIEKPFTPAALDQTIQEALRRRRTKA